MAAVIVALWAEFPDFGSLFLAYLYEACPYLVPHHPPYPLEPSRAEYLALGYKYSEDDVIEEQPKFVKRMTGMARLWAAVTISGLPKGHESINHPHGLGQVELTLTVHILFFFTSRAAAESYFAVVSSSSSGDFCFLAMVSVSSLL